jgi:hypothetical protein
MAECKNCGARWGSPQFLDMKPMKQIILWRAPSDGYYRGLEGFSKPPSFWTSNSKRAYEKYGPKYGPALSGWDPEKCPRCGEKMTRGWIGSSTYLMFEPIEETYPVLPSLSYPSGSRRVGGFRPFRSAGIRAYLCFKCELYVAYEQDPKTGERASKEEAPPYFPYYTPPKKEN